MNSIILTIIEFLLLFVFANILFKSPLSIMLSPRMCLFPWAGFGVKEEEIRVEDSLHSRIISTVLSSKVFIFERHCTILVSYDFGVDVR